LRIETAVESNAEISIYFDPMIAKLIVWDKHRNGAHRKMRFVLQNLKCLGLTTNQDFLVYLFNQSSIQEGKYSTNYLETDFDFEAFKNPLEKEKDLFFIGASLFNWHQNQSKRALLHALPSGWRNNLYSPQQIIFIQAEDKEIKIEYTHTKDNTFQFNIEHTSFKAQLILVEQNHIKIQLEDIQYSLHLIREKNTFYMHSPEFGNFCLTKKERYPIKKIEKVKGVYKAQMPSKIISILVKPGQEVKAGDQLLIVSSMKMENTIVSNESGKVKEVYVKDNQNVDADVLLLKIESESD